MRAAINLEAFFAVLVLLAACRASFSRPAEKGSRSWIFLLLVLPAAYYWTLSFPLLSDDFAHIGKALQFTFDKVPSLFTIPAGDLFFRPLGYLSYAIDARWAGHSEALWHLSTLVLQHFLNCLLVYVLARQKDLGRFFAVTAALFFGIHGSRPESVTWIACRFDLLATLFVLSTLCLYLASSRSDNRRPLLIAAAFVTAFLALISKEVAYVLPVLLLLITDRPQWRRVAPFFALTGIVFLYRWHVLSGIGGYQTASHTPTILNFSILRTLNALFLRLWATLFFPINWTEAAQWWLWIALLLGGAAYGIIGLLGRRDRRTLSFLLFTFIAALPAQHLLLISADLEKSRVLYLPSVGFALFIGAVVESLRLVTWRIPAGLAIICFQLACLEHNLITWRGVAMDGKHACDSVAAAMEGNQKTVTVLDLPNVVRGVYFLHEDMADCLQVWHGVDVEHRLRPENGDIVVHWDPENSAVKMKLAAQ